MHIQVLLSIQIARPKLYQEFERANFVIQILGSQLSRIHYGQANNKTIKYIKGPIDFVNCASDEFRAGGRSQDPKLSNI